MLLPQRAPAKPDQNHDGTFQSAALRKTHGTDHIIRAFAFAEPVENALAPAFKADIEQMQFEPFQLRQLLRSFRQNRRAVRIGSNARQMRKRRIQLRQNRTQALHRQMHDVSIRKKHAGRFREETSGLADFCGELRRIAQSVPHALVHSAEAARVVRTAVCHLKNQTFRFRRRTEQRFAPFHFPRSMISPKLPAKRRISSSPARRVSTGISAKASSSIAASSEQIPPIKARPLFVRRMRFRR